MPEFDQDILADVRRLVKAAIVPGELQLMIAESKKTPGEYVHILAFVTSEKHIQPVAIVPEINGIYREYKKPIYQLDVHSGIVNQRYADDHPDHVGEKGVRNKKNELQLNSDN